MTVGKSVAAMVLVLGLGACQGGNLQTPLGGTGATVGTLGGAAAGGLLGSQFGGGSGSTLATVGGTLIGGFLGHELGQRLDQPEQTRAAQAERQALATNAPTSWSDPKRNVSGQVQPVRTFTDAAGRECREYTHTVNVQGQTQTGSGVACRQPDGTWALVGS